MQKTLAEMQQLATGDPNRLASFTPRLRVAPEVHRDRHTPILCATAPWDADDRARLEVPEYAWARVPDDPSNGSPFFYGRAITTQTQWTMRYPSKEPPTWRETERGALALDNPLEGGYIVRFRVVPHDRLIEVRFGITNGSAKPLTDLRCQLCAHAHMIKGLAERRPTASRLLSRGELISWDGAGQDLSWLNPYRRPDGSFTQSCFFNAFTPWNLPPNWAAQPRFKDPHMWLDRTVDVPAIAKCDPAATRFLIVYSPFSRAVMYNCLVPCFHADPQMDRVAPGETRWTVNYYLFFEGDIAALLSRLAARHQELRRDDGVPG